MEVYLRSTQGGYLTANQGLANAPVTAGSAQPTADSILVIENYDPVSRRTTGDPNILSQNLVILCAPSGSLLVPSGDPAAPKLTAAGPVSAPRMGYEVLRIFKVGGQKGDPIQPGDRVVFRFTNADEVPITSWMSVRQVTSSIAEVLFRADVSVPQDGEMFDLLLPVDLADFHIDYNELINELVGEIALTAPAPPGGQAVILESPDAPDLFPTADLVLENEQTAAFSVELPEPFQEISPCRPRVLTIRATFQSSGTSVESQVNLEGDRAHFMGLKMAGAKRIKSAVPIGRATLAEVQATLSLDPLERRLQPDSLPLIVVLSGDATIRNLVQESKELDFDQPIRFSFQVQQPPEDSPPVCSVLRASYRLDGKHRLSQFAVRISHRGIALDPQ